MFKEQYPSINIKLNIMVITTSVLILILGFIVLFYQSEKIGDSLYQQTKTTLIDKAKNEIDSKMSVGITNAISLSSDKRIQEAFKTDNRELAIESLKEISHNMKSYTDFKNIKVHLHTKDNFSFLRSWRQDTYGDDLSDYRFGVVSVNLKKEPKLTFEIGRAGLLLRAIMPVFDENKQHIGSLEFMQGINSIVRTFAKKSEGFVLLMDKKVSQNIEKDKQFYFTKKRVFKEYIIAQKFVNDTYMEDAKNIDFKELFQQGYTLGSKYFYTYSTIRDFRQKSLGIILLGKPLFNVNTAIEEANKIVSLSLALIISMILIIVGIIILSIRKLVIHPLKEFETGLLNFFNLLQGKKRHSEPIDIETNDEFGIMAKSVNKNISVSINLHQEIKELNNSLEQKVLEKTKKMSTLLNNAGQGFLSFSSDFKIDEEYSLQCLKYLGDDFFHKDIASLLFKDKTKRAFFKQTISDVFSMKNSSTKYAFISLLPHEVFLNRRVLKIEYRLLEQTKMMLILSNISAQKKLERKVKEKQEILKMIVEIVGDSDLFFDIKKEYELFISDFHHHIDEKKTSLHNINDIYRVIHTFKGSFSQLYMSQSSDNLHQLETHISLLIKENNHSNKILFDLISGYDLESSFHQELQIIEDILGTEFLNSKNFIQIPSSELKNLKSNIFDLFSKKDFHTQETQNILSQLTHLSSPKLIKLLKPYKQAVKQLSLRLNKEIYEMKIIGDNDVIIDESFKPLIKSFIHLFRNSIDHGIELPEERLLKNKDEIGTISCSFKETDRFIEIIIADDGAGMDKNALMQKALEKNIFTQKELLSMNESDIYAVIFKEQFSTKNEVSNISGRGIGMSAVAYESEKLNVTITINTQKDKGTSFIFKLPKGNELC